MYRHAIPVSAIALVALGALACDEEAPTQVDEPTPTMEQASVVSENSVSALAIALPVNQNVATNGTAPAFRINQTGSGPNGIFQISNANNAAIALLGQTSGRGIAVRGLATSTSGRAGSFQISNAGNNQAALLGQTNGTGFGVHGVATGNGIPGRFEVNNANSQSPAISASSNGKGNGILAFNFGTGRAGSFVISNPNSVAHALHTESNSSGQAIRGVNTGQGGAAEFRIEAASNSRPALYVFTRGGGPAAYFLNPNGGLAISAGGPSEFIGNVTVFGTLSKSAGSFRIDHPLDPEHKYLSHSFVESPDMLNVYDGTAVLDGRGEAVVMLPNYFEALNRDFRYQLTAIGAPGPNLHVSQEVRNNRFVIAGGVPGTKVSWLVTGVRQDSYAEEHRIQVETDKPTGERGVARASRRSISR